MSENFPRMSGKARFLKVYEQELRKQVETNPELYRYGVDKVPSVAERMVDSLTLKMAHVDSPAVRATCKALDIKCTIGAVAEYIRHGGDDGKA